jgi:uncharacterized protein
MLAARVQRRRRVRVLKQRWQNVLFLHWPVAPEHVRPLVTKELELDLFAGAAWVGIVAFEVKDTRPLLLPPIPGLSDAIEINLRTYVRHEGVPGVWFLSMEIDNGPMAFAARALLRLPYRRAEIELRSYADVHELRSTRVEGFADLSASWRVGEPISSPSGENLDAFVLNRFYAYAAEGPILYRQHVVHPAWPLRKTELLHHDSNLAEAVGLPHLSGAPLIHAADGVSADIHLPELLRAPMPRMGQFGRAPSPL